jgi:imidazole glycerol-phosphate synthase subunit HisF
MLRPRIIPCLLIHNGGLVKTVQFGAPKYVGDPLNAVRIFNEKEVDELLVVDIDASRLGRAPNEALIAQLAAECRMPLCYGGGVKTVEQFERLIALGVEKVAVSSAAVDEPDLVTRAAERVGSQSVVVVIDVKTPALSRQAEVVTLNATKRSGLDPVAFARKMQDLGAGEIVLNSVDRDGQMQGYDLDLVARLRQSIGVPLTVLGGAASLDDIRGLVRRYPVIGAAAGSLFVFKGRYRAVLINYPSRSERDALAARTETT